VNIRKVMSLTSLFLLLSFVVLGMQNCGRVSVTEPSSMPVSEAASLSISLSSELVIPVSVNQTARFSVPASSDGARVIGVSFNPEFTALETETALMGRVSIDSSDHSLTYDPPVGLIGYDQSLIFVKGSDGSLLQLKVLFVIKSASQENFLDLNALVYGDSAEDRVYLQNKLSGYAPPGMSEIFNKWGRFSGNLWFNSAADIKTKEELSYCNSGIDSATGLFNSSIDPATGKTINPGTYGQCANNPEFVATSWTLLGDPQRIYCASNAGKLTGFVSPISFEYYEHEAIVTSTNSDDDTIGVVIAFHRDKDGNNHVLAASRTHGGLAPALGWAVVYYINGTVKKVIGESSVGGVRKNGTTGGTGWSGLMSKINVVREGNVIEAVASEWGTTESSLTLNQSSKISIDLNDESLGLGLFKGARPYGYVSYSQLGSDYRGVNFSTGSTDTYVYDLLNKIVYEKQASGAYLERRDLDAYTHIGFPRKVGNPDTGRIYFLNSNKTFKLMN